MIKLSHIYFTYAVPLYRIDGSLVDTATHRFFSSECKGKYLSRFGNPNGYLIGSMGVDDLDIAGTHRAEVGYWLAPAYRGKGLISDALGVFVEYAFNNLEVTRLTAHTLDFNKASARVLEKNRFTLEGCLRQHTKTRNGLFDILAWGLLKSDLEVNN